MRYTPDYKSRFRILKGGKISLVVSAIMLGGVVNVAQAVTINDAQTSTQTFTTGNSEDFIIAPAGSISAGTSTTAISITTNPLAAGHYLTNDGSISLDGATDASTIFTTLDTFGSIVNNNTIKNLNAVGEAAGINIGLLNKGSIINNEDSLIHVTSTSGNSFAWGIYASNLTDGATTTKAMIKNEGDITVESIKDSYGIKIASDLLGSEIKNTGFLTVKAEGGNTVTSYGIFVGNKSSNNTELPQITNEGFMDITATADDGYYSYADALGIKVKEAEATKLENTKQINVTSTSGSGGTEARATSYGMDFEKLINNSQIINTKTITSTATALKQDYSYAQAYGIRSLETSDSTINNSGTISAKATGNYGTSTPTKAAGIDLVVSGDYEMPTSITNSKTIKAEVVSDDFRAASYGVKIDNTLNVFELTNDGSGANIQALVNGGLDKKGYSVDIRGNGNSTITNSGYLGGNIHAEADVTNSGVIELAYNANGVDNAYIKNFTNYGTLKVGLKTDGVTPSISTLKGKNITFKNNSAIDVNVLDNTDESLVAGYIFSNVVTADTSLTIEDKLKITDNSALVDFEYFTSSGWSNGGIGGINLRVVKGSENNVVDKTISGGGNQNSQAAANALQNLYDNNTEIASAFNRLTTDSAVASAVESTTPIATSSSVGAASQIANGISSIVTQRQNANISSGGLNSGDGLFSENNLWIKPFAGMGKQKDKNSIKGFDLKTYGFGIGADSEYGDNQKIGLALFYVNADVDVNGMSQNSDLDVFTALIYGNTPVFDGKTNFLYQAGYTWQKTDTSRGLFTGKTAKSKYTSKVASLDLKLMRDVHLNNRFLLQPIVNTTYRHFINPSYSESGAGALNLNVDKFTSSEFIVGGGAIAHYKLDEASKIIGSFNIGYDLKNDKNKVTSAYQGAVGSKFHTVGIDNGRWNYEAGIGYERELNNTNSINLSYDYQAEGSKFSNNVFSAKYVLKF